MYKCFYYPSFSNYFCFKEVNDSSTHNYANIIKINDIYNLINFGTSNKIKIWDFYKKNLIKRIINNGIISKNFIKHTSSVSGIKAIKDKENNQYVVSYGNDKNIYYEV